MTCCMDKCEAAVTAYARRTHGTGHWNVKAATAV